LALTRLIQRTNYTVAFRDLSVTVSLPARLLPLRGHLTQFATEVGDSLESLWHTASRVQVTLRSPVTDRGTGGEICLKL
jgi:hypothetical protein